LTETDRSTALAPVLREAARRYGTPVTVTDLGTLDAACAAVRDAFPDPWLRAFSVKANDVAGVVRLVCERGFGANVVSRGEWAIARRAGVANARITFEGIGKTDADLRAAVRSAAQGDPIRWLAIESLDEARALVSIAAQAALGGGRRRRSLDVLFRLNPEVQPETHHGLAVGAASSKFGMTATELTEAVGIVGEARGLVPRGIHLHVGSQLGAVDAWRDAVRRGLALLALVSGTRARFDTLDVGGGFPVFPRNQPTPDPARFAAELPALLEAIPAERRPARLAIEPGRALVARAGFILARVLHVREREGSRQIVLDAGMTELIRPALYDAWHEIEALTSLGRPLDARPRSRRGTTRIAEPGLEPARVVGPICESTDHLGEHLLPPLRRGDLVVVHDAGAYGASLASAYNGRARPPQLLARADGGLTLLRARGRIAALG
jgi:diaminopimelate decarboxylase